MGDQVPVIPRLAVRALLLVAILAGTPGCVTITVGDALMTTETAPTAWVGSRSLRLVEARLSARNQPAGAFLTARLLADDGLAREVSGWSGYGLDNVRIIAPDEAPLAQGTPCVVREPGDRETDPVVTLRDGRVLLFLPDARSPIAFAVPRELREGAPGPETTTSPARQTFGVVAFVLVLPVTVALDIVTAPFQIIFFLREGVGTPGG